MGREFHHGAPRGSTEEGRFSRCGLRALRVLCGESRLGELRRRSGIAVFTLISVLAPPIFAQRKPAPAPRAEERVQRYEKVIAEPGAVRRQGAYWVEEIQGRAPAAAEIRVESAEGAIHLIGAAQDDVSYRVVKRVPASNEQNARRILAAHPLRVLRRQNRLVLVVHTRRPGAVQTEYHVTVPKQTRLADLEARVGAISARDIDGTVRAATAGGGIEVNGIGGDARLETAGGHVTIGSVGGRVIAETGGGNIRIGSGGGEVQAQTAGGNIDVNTAGGAVRAATAGGNIRIGKAGGDVTAETAGGSVMVGEARRVRAATAGGSIRVQNASLVTAETAAGPIHLEGCSGPIRVGSAAGSIMARITAVQMAWGESTIETTAGDITVYLPNDLRVTIQAAIEMATGRHRITSDFPLHLQSAEGPGPREIVGQGTVNGGGAPLRLRTVSGNIEIRSVK